MAKTGKTGLALIIAGIALPLALFGLTEGFTPDLGLSWNLRNMEVVFHDSVADTYMDIVEFRERFPMYNDIPGEELARRLHGKYFKKIISAEGFNRAFLPAAGAAEPGAYEGEPPDPLGIRGGLSGPQDFLAPAQAVLELDALEFGLVSFERKRVAVPFRYSLIAGCAAAAAGLILITRRGGP
jgi:hypothetical protein